ncbi:MAG: hypothetical protein HGB21_07365, partial [Nitrospirae bacterium]|nr:hypothetical protein [Nitrospirota bacterium]
GEYGQGHIPGAALVPLGDLYEREREFDRSRPTVLYCRSGNRSRAAASILLDAGFTNVFSMEGGIQAWSGLVVDGPPEAGMVLFSGREKPEELIALAWSLEEGSRRFYRSMASALEDREAVGLFDGLVRAEDHHQAALVGVYREATGDTAVSAIPEVFFLGAVPGEVMEGGMSVMKALEWVKGKEVNDVLDLSLALESHAFDLYIRMARELAGESAKRVFQVLAAEEKVHLDRMVALLEKRRFPGAS